MDNYEREQLGAFRGHTLATFAMATKEGFEQCKEVATMCQSLDSTVHAQKMREYMKEYLAAREELRELMTKMTDAETKRDVKQAKVLNERVCITVALAAFIVSKLRDTYRLVKPLYDAELKQQGETAAWVAEVPVTRDALVRHVALAFVAQHQQTAGALTKDQLTAGLRALFQSAAHQAAVTEAYGGLSADDMLVELERCYVEQHVERQRVAEAEAAAEAARLQADQQAEADAIEAATMAAEAARLLAEAEADAARQQAAAEEEEAARQQAAADEEAVRQQAAAAEEAARQQAEAEEAARQQAAADEEAALAEVAWQEATAEAERQLAEEAARAAELETLARQQAAARAAAAAAVVAQQKAAAEAERAAAKASLQAEIAREQEFYARGLEAAVEAVHAKGAAEKAQALAEKRRAAEVAQNVKAMVAAEADEEANTANNTIAL